MAAGNDGALELQRRAVSEVDKLVAEFDRTFFPDSQDASAFHYTTIDSALKIFSGGSPPHSRAPRSGITLWFSDALTMNDTQEIAEGEALFSRSVGRALERCNITYTFGRKPRSTGHFVLSMSRRRDNLSMWRAYGGDGEGVALELSLQGLKDLHSTAPRQSLSDYSVAPCLYRAHEDVERFLEDNVSGALQRLNDPSAIDHFLVNLEMRFELFLPYIKNPHYEDEQEIRAVYGTRFGVTPAFCVGSPPRRFLAIEFEDSPRMPLVVGATIGPSPNARFHKSVVEHLAIKSDERGTVFPPVAISSIPYRGRAGPSK